MVNHSPLADDTVVEDHTSYDLGELANDAVLADDRPLNARALLDARRAADDRVRGDLGLLVDERPVLGV